MDQPRSSNEGTLSSTRQTLRRETTPPSVPPRERVTRAELLARGHQELPASGRWFVLPMGRPSKR
jgi:hypothetical protein